jgi:hypothetical protein
MPTTRPNRYTHDGITLTLVEWADRTGLDTATLWCRIHRRGWTLERSLATPARGRYTSLPRATWARKPKAPPQPRRVCRHCGWIWYAAADPLKCPNTKCCLRRFWNQDAPAPVATTKSSGRKRLPAPVRVCVLPPMPSA